MRRLDMQPLTQLLSQIIHPYARCLVGIRVVQEASMDLNRYKGALDQLYERASIIDAEMSWVEEQAIALGHEELLAFYSGGDSCDASMFVEYFYEHMTDVMRQALAAEWDMSSLDSPTWYVVQGYTSSLAQSHQSLARFVAKSLYPRLHDLGQRLEDWADNKEPDLNEAIDLGLALTALPREDVTAIYMAHQEAMEKMRVFSEQQRGVHVTN